VYRFVWHGHPTNNPAIRIRGNKAYVSWNGATDVAKWRAVVDGRSGSTIAKRHFEDALIVPASARQVAVIALSASGAELGRSKTISR
jgi:hypothetical protein